MKNNKIMEGLFLAFIGTLIFLFGVCIGVQTDSTLELKSNVKLEPKLIITKQGVKIDTLYVYEKQ